jgi:hypothetical protein
MGVSRQLEAEQRNFPLARNSGAVQQVCPANFSNRVRDHAC